ncbi:hypothetical protein C8Q80DRAFT_1137854 [Daedaleopsis nitida]|nr:hypothetical protein C8Q80DRAFT_1137854 [Daedaleopsis nitida]
MLIRRLTPSMAARLRQMVHREDPTYPNMAYSAYIARESPCDFRIPVELFYLVLKILKDEKALAPCILVSCQWQVLAQPMLLSSVVIRDDESLQSLTRFLKQRPEYYHHVHNLTFRGEIPNSPISAAPVYESAVTGRPWPVDLASEKSPGQGAAGDDEGYYLTLEYGSIAPLLDQFHRLQSLVMQNVDITIERSDISALTANSRPRSRHLQILDMEDVTSNTAREGADVLRLSPLLLAIHMLSVASVGELRISQDVWQHGVRDEPSSDIDISHFAAPESSQPLVEVDTLVVERPLVLEAWHVSRHVRPRVCRVECSELQDMGKIPAFLLAAGQGIVELDIDTIFGDVDQWVDEDSGEP